jgi:acyl dehydratase
MTNGSSNVFIHNTGIDPREVEETRKLIGQELRFFEFNTSASLDGIRHYAWGYGDDNPLYCDEEYAAKGPYGGIVAPPTFPYSVFSPGVTPGFPGLQLFFGTGIWQLHRPIRLGEKIRPRAKFTDMFEVKGSVASRMIVQVGETTYYDEQGGTLAVYISKSVRVPRAGREGALQYKPRESYRYSQEEMDRIEKAVLGHRRRGSEPRFFEHVKEGEQLPALVKGPLTLSGLIAFYAGSLPAGYFAPDIAWRIRDRARNAPDTLPNNRAVGWLAETTWPGMGHMEGNVAHSVGMPGAYDNGWMRLAWVGQLVTDWMGDRGELKTLEVRHTKPNLIGDTLWCRGEVTGKSTTGGRGIVHIALSAENQLGETCSVGKASVALPASP